LIADGFSASPDGFRYKYLQDAHTSLVGASELAVEHNSLTEDEAWQWLNAGGFEKRKGLPGLFAFPAQSNLNGRRFPLEWIAALRNSFPGWYCLLDASSYLTTTPLDYSDSDAAPDFTTFSFYKIYGYPDIGGVIVRKSAAHMLIQRHFYGGGTRSAMTVESWNRPRDIVHEALEDGTLPFHSILALDAALTNYQRLFGANIFVARHAAQVTRLAYILLSSLHHPNGRKACEIYSQPNHGPIISFNVVNENGTQVGFKSFEKQATLRNFAIRTGGMCNPGGMQTCLNLKLGDIERIFANGKICGDDQDIVEGKNFGMIRISFGASSTAEEVCAFVDFVRECYVDKKRRLLIWRKLGQEDRSVKGLSDALEVVDIHTHKYF
jgi:molybdenum cofactor sulfurtransferase